MITKTMTIKNSIVETRTVAVLVQVASQFESTILLEVPDKKINAKSMMGMMSIGLSVGDTIDISADGNDEKEAIEKIEQFLTEE